MHKYYKSSIRYFQWGYVITMQ